MLWPRQIQQKPEPHTRYKEESLRPCLYSDWESAHSYRWRRKFSCRFCQDSNSQLFNHENENENQSGQYKRNLNPTHDDTGLRNKACSPVYALTRANPVDLTYLVHAQAWARTKVWVRHRTLHCCPSSHLRSLELVQCHPCSYFMAVWFNLEWWNSEFDNWSPFYNIRAEREAERAAERMRWRQERKSSMVALTWTEDCLAPHYFRWKESRWQAWRNSAAAALQSLGLEPGGHILSN